MVDHRAAAAEQAARGAARRRSAGLERHPVAVSHGIAMGGGSRTLRPTDNLLQSLRALAKGRGLGSASRSGFRSLRRRHRYDRFLLCPCPPARGHGKKGGGDDGCMGRSRGGLTSKIHALVDAEGRPVTLRLTAGQIADCTQGEALIEGLGEGDILLADKGYDSDAIRAKAEQRKAWANI